MFSSSESREEKRQSAESSLRTEVSPLHAAGVCRLTPGFSVHRAARAPAQRFGVKTGARSLFLFFKGCLYLFIYFNLCRSVAVSEADGYAALFCV